MDIAWSIGAPVSVMCLLMEFLGLAVSISGNVVAFQCLVFQLVDMTVETPKALETLTPTHQKPTPRSLGRKTTGPTLLNP